MSRRRIVIFGGTFDPVTTGHMVVAAEAYRLLQPDELWFLVNNIPGERKRVYAPAAVRLEMVRAAVGADSRFIVADDEIRRGGVTYTADTMTELHGAHPDATFELLLGVDSARSIRSWRSGDAVLRDERFVIVNRSGEPRLTELEAAELGYAPGRTRIIEIASPGVSASEVRLRVATGGPLEALVPPAVAEIIRRDGLYARRPARA